MRRTEGGGVLDGARHAVAKLGDAIRVTADAALAGIPVAGGQVVQHQFELVFYKLALQLGGRVGVGEQELDGLETGPGGALEAVEERDLGEEHREVGGEAGHGGVLGLVFGNG